MRTDEIELEIIKFIEKNPGRTINQVSQAMSENGVSSRMTTLKKINDLKSDERRIIEDRQEANSFHRLYINDRSEFKLVDTELANIEMTILRMDDNSIKYEEMRQTERSNKQADNVMFFLRMSNQLIDIFLHNVLLRVNNNVSFETDKQILYTKIIKLMVANDLASTSNLQIADVLIEGLRKNMNSESFRNYAKSIGMKLSAMENFILMADNFNKKFLTVDDFKEQVHSLIDGNRNNY
jgi:hypothetical protein